MTAQILVVDDEPDLEALLVQKFRHQIRDRTINFTFVRDGVQALAALKANEKLESASQNKSRFLANMSHELRTPLNAVLGYTELILDDVYGEMPEKARAVLDRIQSNGRHLLGLINDVLDLSKIEAGQLTLVLADYSLKNVIQSVFSA